MVADLFRTCTDILAKNYVELELETYCSGKMVNNHVDGKHTDVHGDSILAYYCCFIIVLY